MKLTDDARSPNPRFPGLFHGTGCLVREEDLRSIFCQLFPVMRDDAPGPPVLVMRQLRSPIYEYITLKQFVQGQGRSGEPLSNVMTSGVGAVAGLVTVYTT